MDPKEILRRVEALKLTSDVQTRSVQISTTEAARGSKRADKLVMGKVYGKRQLNRETLRTKLPEIFQIRGTCEVEIVRVNLFVIAQDLEYDREQIVEDGPWHWFSDLMLVKRVDSMATAANTIFDEITMWIQLHNLPIACMESQIVRRIGEKVGRILEVDEGPRGLSLGRYARVRITRKIDEPLVRGIPITTEGTEEQTIILILYEKLPELFCYACGKIGHHMKDCDLEEDEKSNPAYGGWMRAGRGIDYRRVTYGPNHNIAKENPHGPWPPPRQEKRVERDGALKIDISKAVVVSDEGKGKECTTNQGGELTAGGRDGEMEIDGVGEDGEGDDRERDMREMVERKGGRGRWRTWIGKGLRGRMGGWSRRF